ncbi:hypothetical protein V493_05057 [Pseudogymnoascus sp. VKM F-4281 (FW-2241)]|nr:hypothetical protein V493_05057 [Pseudogymnoascus sp. VKM F-4281 (FW-2241)]
MADITVQLVNEHPSTDEIKAECESLERELFAVNRQKARLIEERRVEDRAMRLSRARQNEFIASTRRKEDSDTLLRIGEGSEHYRVEQENSRLSRADEDERFASNRRKEDASAALRRIAENKECDLIKSGITQKQSELKAVLESITRHPPGQDGRAVISKRSPQVIEEIRPGYYINNSMRKEPKMREMVCRQSSYQGLASEKVSPNIAAIQVPSSPPSTLMHHKENRSWHQLQPSIHPSRLQLLAQDLIDTSSSHSGGTGRITTKHPQSSRPVLTAILEDCGSLNDMGPSRKRKATSPPRLDHGAPPFHVEKKRVSFRVKHTQHPINREYPPALEPVINDNPVSLQSLLQPCEIFNQHRTPSVPTGPKLHFGSADIKQRLTPGIPTGPKLHSGAGDIRNFNQQLLPGTPNGPKVRTSVEGVCQADICRLLGYTPGSGIVNLQTILIMHKSDQVHAPDVERAKGIYYTFLQPEPPRLGHFPVIVSTEAGGTYKYMGNYVLDGSHLLRDSEVDKLGEETCRALATSQLIDASRQVLKREFFEVLINKGVVRTDREASKTTALDLAV